MRDSDMLSNATSTPTASTTPANPTTGAAMAEKQTYVAASAPVTQTTADTSQDDYFGKRLPNGKTQFQIDMEANAKATAALLDTKIDATGKVVPPAPTDKATTNVDVMKSLLRGMGYNAKIIDSSTSYINQLLQDGLDYDNAISIYLDSKDYTLKSGTKITSPFYQEYGYLNEGLPEAKTANELYNAVEGFRGIQSKYGLSDKYVSPDSLKQYIKNGVTVADLDERANTARLKAINADPVYTEALVKQGYIGSAADLQDFYLNPKIGQEQLDINRKTAAFATEALRRASQGIGYNAERFAQQAAGLAAKGLSEAQISTAAAQGFQTISEQLNPMIKLAGIYEGSDMKAAEQNAIQAQLEAEQFGGLASERRKKLKAQEEAAFSAQTGTSRYSLSSGATAGIL